MKNINDMQTIRELLEEFAKEYNEEDIEYIFIGSDSKNLDLDTEEEKELFAQFLTRSIANMGPGPCERKPKEEETV